MAMTRQAGRHGKHGNVKGHGTTACLTTDSTDYTDVNDCDNGAVIWSAVTRRRFDMPRSDAVRLRRSSHGLGQFTEPGYAVRHRRR